jgi:hypothetical protein
MCDALWEANKSNQGKVAEVSFKAYPLPPIMANLNIMSDNQFSKLLADVQKRSFYFGALAALTTISQITDDVLKDEL